MEGKHHERHYPKTRHVRRFHPCQRSCPYRLRQHRDDSHDHRHAPPLFASSAAPVAATATAPAPAPSATPASSQICTSHACIVSDVEKSLVGLVAKDESVITKAVCYKSTVKANPGDTYTVSCDVTYSDGTVYSGDATLLVAKDQIAWEPTGQVS